MTTPADTACPHGMPTPGSCLDCMDEGLLPPPPKPEPEAADSHAFAGRYDADTLRVDKFEMQKLLDRALQEAWDDYVGDTHCHPPDFTVEGGRSNYTLSASFRSNWTLYAAERLSLWLAAAVPQDPERCACGKPATGTVDGIPTCGDDR